MNYILTVLTNGRRTCFERSIHAFMQHVRPLPDRIYVFDDGGQTGEGFVDETISAALVKQDAGAHLVYDESSRPLGMCAAHKNCHDFAATQFGEDWEIDWAFHLEDDFVILRPVDLRDLAAVLDAEPTCKQMALVRCPWGKEIEFGGYIPHMPGHYERRKIDLARETLRVGYAHDNDRRRLEWIATQRNWATNPALMRTELLRRYPWPAEPGCETTIGPRILEDEPDAVFGLWGWGEPWAAHIALERQPGAFGY